MGRVTTRADERPVDRFTRAGSVVDGRGVWYHVVRGVRGLLVHDERGMPVVYVVCEPASHYYKNVTASTWMPVLIGQRY